MSQQAFVDTYSKVAFAKLDTTKTPIAAVDVLNDRRYRSSRHRRCQRCAS
jgi:urate oxidase